MRQYFLQKKKLETKKFTRGGLAKFYKGGAGGTRGGLFVRGGTGWFSPIKKIYK